MFPQVHGYYKYMATVVFPLYWYLPLSVEYCSTPSHRCLKLKEIKHPEYYVISVAVPREKSSNHSFHKRLKD